MEAKLIKDKHIDDFYYLKIGINTYATTHKESFRILSLKNCQAIGRSYNFDEYDEAIAYASEFGHPSPEGFSDEQIGRLHGFIDGFQKALEILGDKKFSEEDMKKAIYIAWEGGDLASTHIIESLQQTEWDVEIVMDVCGDKVYAVPEPFLDTDGCLILKRKI